MISKRPHILIVGAGIVGASLAYHLTKKNAQVTVIDKAAAPGFGVTGKSFAWINTMHNEPGAYLNIRQQAIADWHRLENELSGKLKIDWCGTLSWQQDAAETEHVIHNLINAGHKVRKVYKEEIHALEPALKIIPGLAMFAEDEGAVDASNAAKLLLQAARDAGANVYFNTEVLSFITDGLRVLGVVTANKKIHADVVVLASGTDAIYLCKSLDVSLPVNISPAILIDFYMRQRFINRIVSNPFMEIRAASDTVLLAAEDYIDESAVNNLQVIAQRTLINIKKHWFGAEHLRLENVLTGNRPIPVDGLPVIGSIKQIEGLYLLVMHAGVTLAVTAGKMAADEILNKEDDSLSSFRFERFKVYNKHHN